MHRPSRCLAGVVGGAITESGAGLALGFGCIGLATKLDFIAEGARVSQVLILVVAALTFSLGGGLTGFAQFCEDGP